MAAVAVLAVTYMAFWVMVVSWAYCAVYGSGSAAPGAVAGALVWLAGFGLLLL